MADEEAAAAQGYDPEQERDRQEVTVDEDQGGGQTRRFYVKTATQDGNLVAVSLEAAPGTYLTWDDVDTTLAQEVRKMMGQSGNGRRRKGRSKS